MSRLGKQAIVIPSGTSVTLGERGLLSVKGPLGELSRKLRPEVRVEIEGESVRVAKQEESKFANALWGTYASHITNMVRGVNTPFEKKLVVEGVGFRVERAENQLTLHLGFSHPVAVAIPEGLTVSVEKNAITITGIDTEAVGQFAAKVRAIKKPEPYKGKGIRYGNEVVRRKQGKKAA
jgi:large subunit ribosomal protein L6